MAGVAPKFSPLDVLRALLLLSDDPMSRADIVGSLGLGEGSVRSILDELKDEGLADSSRKGHVLSKEGASFKTSVLQRIRGPMPAACDVFKNPFRSAVLIRKPEMGVDPVSLRDVALKWGADAALVLVMRDYNLDLIKFDQRIDLSDVSEAFRPKEGDVVVIAFADSSASADTAALAVAIRADPLLRGLVSKKFGGKSQISLSLFSPTIPRDKKKSRDVAGSHEREYYRWV